MAEYVMEQQQQDGHGSHLQQRSTDTSSQAINNDARKCSIGSIAGRLQQ
jgi:hypothetical protein